MSRSARSPECSDHAEERRSLSILAAQIEAVLFFVVSPVPSGELQSVLGVSGGEVSSALGPFELPLFSRREAAARGALRLAGARTLRVAQRI